MPRRLFATRKQPGRLTTAIHNAGGTNDDVIACCVINVSQLNVSVVDVLLSDDHLLTWLLPGRKKPLRHAKLYIAARGAQLDVTQSTAVKASRLCQSTMWPDDIDDVCPVRHYVQI